MVIDCAKGVEERTIKLMEVCRLRDTPIMTFINKLDRDGRPPIELLDEIEKRAQDPHRARHLADRHGARARGIYHLLEDRIYAYAAGESGARRRESSPSTGLPAPRRRNSSATRRAFRR